MEGDSGAQQSLSSMHSSAAREAASAQTDDAPVDKSPEKDIPVHPSERYTR